MVMRNKDNNWNDLSISPTVFLIQQLPFHLTKTYSLFCPTILSEAFREGLSPDVSLVLASALLMPVARAIFSESTGSESKNSVENAMIVVHSFLNYYHISMADVL